MAALHTTQRQPTTSTCIECGRCDQACPMNISVMQFIQSKRPVTSADCVLCEACARACVVRAIR